MSLNLPEVVLVPIEDASTVYMQCISPGKAFLRIPRCVWNAPSPPPAAASTRPRVKKMQSPSNPLKSPLSGGSGLGAGAVLRQSAQAGRNSRDKVPAINWSFNYNVTAFRVTYSSTGLSSRET